MMLVLCALLLLVIVNATLKSSVWYESKFGDALRVLKCPSNLDVVNVGSTSAKYGFDYSGVGARGANCAVGPQSIAFDCKVLRFIIERVRPGGVAVIPIVPFSSILDAYETATAHDKYYVFLPACDIPHFNFWRQISIGMQKNFPIIYWIRHPGYMRLLLARYLGRQVQTENSFQHPIALSEDAEKWIEGWKQQFSLKHLMDPISPVQKEIMAKNAVILHEMVEICRAKKVTPVFVLPPMSEPLLKFLTSEVRKRYIYDLIEGLVGEDKVLFFDYTKEAKFSNPLFFSDAFLLNKQGRMSFTQDLVLRIKASQHDMYQE